jgi:hypothetical protein
MKKHKIFLFVILTACMPFFATDNRQYAINQTSIKTEESISFGKERLAELKSSHAHLKKRYSQHGLYNAKFKTEIEDLRKHIKLQETYIENLQIISDTLKTQGDLICDEITTTGTSQTLVDRAPTPKRPGMAENANTFNTIWLIKFYLENPPTKKSATLKMM